MLEDSHFKSNTISVQKTKVVRSSSIEAQHIHTKDTCAVVLTVVIIKCQNAIRPRELASS